MSLQLSSDYHLKKDDDVSRMWQWLIGPGWADKQGSGPLMSRLFLVMSFIDMGGSV